MMTEEEAKTKWCPDVRLRSAGEFPAYNRVQDLGAPFPHALFPNAASCIGSACMAWRATDNAKQKSLPDGASPPVFVAAGYCGRAGKP
ncbi:hypothetical protein [Acidocella sp.]|jgi:hypothetical protein|uniref:hypothetical protein n=1 Tax=Acidocella sp. TaxID=50710 RepID=UPI002F427B1A